MRAASTRFLISMTSSPRVYLWLALGILVFFNYQAWMTDYGLRLDGAPSAVDGATAAAGKAATAAAAAHGSALDAAIPTAPGANTAPAATPAPAQSAPPASSSAEALPAAPPAGTAAAPSALPTAAPAVHVLTDVLDLEISTIGGTLQKADLLSYPLVKGRPEPVEILNHDNPDTLYVVQTGLSGAGSEHPTHLATFESAQPEYRMDGASELRVPLTWTDGHGVTVTKTFVLHRGQYRIDVDYDVRNSSGAPWSAAPYAQIRSHATKVKRTMFDVESYAFKGPAVYDGTKYRKLNVEDADEHLAADISNGWIAALQHHFVAAIVPPADVPYRFTLAVDGHHYQLSSAGPAQSVPAGQEAHFTQTLFVGPKLQSQLDALSPELSRVADYGKLTIISRPLFWLLNKAHALFGNWGIAIILVTALLKLLFYPLSEASGRSMAKMKALSPRIKNLQETYKDNRDKLGREMMALYQREKVNPVAGCLPMIIQIPVFLAFYWVLLESVEMRQAPFFGWINALSSRDPFFILPAIMAGAMFMQYKLNPAPPDPVQAKVFMIMPFAMSFMFAFFPAGLVLYWVTNTLLSIAQQWNINRRIKMKADA